MLISSKWLTTNNIQIMIINWCSRSSRDLGHIAMNLHLHPRQEIKLKENTDHSCYLKMGQNTKVSGTFKMILEMAGECRSGLMVHYMKATGNEIKPMVEVD